MAEERYLKKEGFLKNFFIKLKEIVKFPFEEVEFTRFKEEESGQFDKIISKLEGFEDEKKYDGGQDKYEQKYYKNLDNKNRQPFLSTGDDFLTEIDEKEKIRVAVPVIFEEEISYEISYEYNLFACVGTMNNFVRDLVEVKKKNNVNERKFSVVEKMLRNSVGDSQFSFLLPTQVLSCEERDSIIFFYVMPKGSNVTFNNAMDATSKDKIRAQIEGFHEKLEQVREKRIKTSNFWKYLYWNVSSYSIVDVKFENLHYQPFLFTPQSLSMATKSFQTESSIGGEMKARCFSTYFWREKLRIDLNTKLNLEGSFDTAWEQAMEKEWFLKRDTKDMLREKIDETNISWSLNMKQKHSYKYWTLFQEQKKRKMDEKFARQVKRRMLRDEAQEARRREEAAKVVRGEIPVDDHKDIFEKFWDTFYSVKRNKTIVLKDLKQQIKNFRYDYFERVLLHQISFKKDRSLLSEYDFKMSVKQLDVKEELAEDDVDFYNDYVYKNDSPIYPSKKDIIDFLGFSKEETNDLSKIEEKKKDILSCFHFQGDRKESTELKQLQSEKERLKKMLDELKAASVSPQSTRYINIEYALNEKEKKIKKAKKNQKRFTQSEINLTEKETQYVQKRLLDWFATLVNRLPQRINRSIAIYFQGLKRPPSFKVPDGIYREIGGNVFTYTRTTENNPCNEEAWKTGIFVMLWFIGERRRKFNKKYGSPFLWRGVIDEKSKQATVLYENYCKEKDNELVGEMRKHMNALFATMGAVDRYMSVLQDGLEFIQMKTRFLDGLLRFKISYGKDSNFGQKGIADYSRQAKRYKNDVDSFQRIIPAKEFFESIRNKGNELDLKSPDEFEWYKQEGDGTKLLSSIAWTTEDVTWEAFVGPQNGATSQSEILLKNRQLLLGALSTLPKNPPRTKKQFKVKINVTIMPSKNPWKFEINDKKDKKWFGKKGTVTVYRTEDGKASVNIKFTDKKETVFAFEEKHWEPPGREIDLSIPIAYLLKLKSEKMNDSEFEDFLQDMQERKRSEERKESRENEKLSALTSGLKEVVDKEKRRENKYVEKNLRKKIKSTDLPYDTPEEWKTYTPEEKLRWIFKRKSKEKQEKREREKQIRELMAELEAIRKKDAKVDAALLDIENVKDLKKLKKQLEQIKKTYEEGKRWKIEPIYSEVEYESYDEEEYMAPREQSGQRSSKGDGNKDGNETAVQESSEEDGNVTAVQESSEEDGNEDGNGTEVQPSDSESEQEFDAGFGDPRTTTTTTTTKGDGDDDDGWRYPFGDGSDLDSNPFDESKSDHLEDETKEEDGNDTDVMSTDVQSSSEEEDYGWRYPDDERKKDFIKPFNRLKF